MSLQIQKFVLLAVVLFGLSGCAEGPFWKTGYVSPWVRQKWSDEEQIAATFFTRRDQMQAIVDNASQAGPAAEEEASRFLSDVVSNDPILLLRIEATRLLAQLPTEIAGKALQVASRDREVEVRRAAVRAWGRRGDDLARKSLTDMIQRDADVDVRIGATAELGQFRGPEVSQVLAEVIQDPNPSLQLRAAESLSAVTGQSFGNDIVAWQRYMQQSMPSKTAQEERTAEAENDSIFK